MVGPWPSLIQPISKADKIGKLFVFVSFMYSCCEQLQPAKNEVKETEKNASKPPVIRYFCFQFVYQGGPRPTLISTICKVNISFLSESELKLFDRSHRHVLFKQEEKVQTLKMKKSLFERKFFCLCPKLLNYRDPDFLKKIPACPLYICR